MPADPDELDAIAATVAQVYAEAETTLVRLVARHLDGDAEAPEWVTTKLGAVKALRRSVTAVLAALQADSSTALREAAAAAYRNGWSSVGAELVVEWFPKSGIGQDAKAAAKDLPGFGAVEALAQAVHRDVGARSSNILRDVLDAYRATIAAASGRILTGTQTRRQASQAAWRGLIDRGLSSFVDRSGRRWRLSSYVEMAARTVTQRAAVTGQTDRLDTLGVTLVSVSNAPRECPLCRPFEGKILRTDNGPTGWIEVPHQTRDGETVRVHVEATLAEARAAGFQHPNCRHSVSAYLPGISRLPEPGSTADPEGYQATQRQRELERAIRTAKLREAGGIDGAAGQVRAAQNRLREHLAAHPELKRLRYREQIGAGNIQTGHVDAAGGIGPTVQPTLDGTTAKQVRPAPAAEPSVVERQAVTNDPGQLDLLAMPEQRAEASHLANALTAGQRKPADLTVDQLQRVDQALAERAAQLGKPGQISPAHKAVRRELDQRKPAPEAPKVEPKPEPPKPGAKVLAQLLDVDDDLTDAALIDRLASGEGTGAERAEWTAAYKRFLALADAGAETAAHKRFLPKLIKHEDPVKLVRRRLGQLKDDEQRAATLRALWRELDRRADTDATPPGMQHGRRFRDNGEAVSWAMAEMPLPPITASERAAVVAYTGNEYRLINNGLRGWQAPPPDKQDRYNKLVKGVDAAFAKASLEEPLIVHRGAGAPLAESLGADLADPASMQALVGKVFQEPGYVSTSIGARAAFSGDIYLMFRIPQGYQAMNAMHLSKYGTSEREILIRRDAHYVVHAAYQRGPAWYIEAEIVPDDWEPGADWAPDPYGDAWEGYR